MNAHSPDWPDPARSRGVRRRLVFAVLLLLAAGKVRLQAGETLAGDDTNSVLRLGFSSSVFVGVNENDAKASVKIWAQAILKEHGVSVPSDPEMFSSSEAIAGAMESKHLDAVTMSAEEYRAVGRELLSTNVVLGVSAGLVTEDYLLVVRGDSHIGHVDELRGRSLIVYQSPRTSLGPVWFETLLLQSGLGRTRQFCGRVTQGTKLSQAVLPVFFRQADSCLVTRRGFQTMVELNPQVGQQLKILVSSPAMVPFAFFFRSDFSGPVNDQILAEIRKVHSTAAGQQVLTLFQCEHLEVCPIGALDSALDLLAAHERLSEAARHAEPPITNIPLLDRVAAGP
jgi:ABC transporter, phosphonate, periplasmic substrate-binding protein